MRVLVQVQNLHVVQLDVQVLVDRLEDSTDADVIFKLDGNGLVGKGLKEAVQEKLVPGGEVHSRNEDCKELGLVPEEKHDGGEWRTRRVEEVKVELESMK